MRTPWVNMHDVLCSCLGTKIIILKQIWVVKACLWERWASFASKIRKSSRPPTARTARSRSLKQHLSNYTCKGMTLLSWNLCPTLDGETFGWQTDLRQVEAHLIGHRTFFRHILEGFAVADAPQKNPLDLSRLTMGKAYRQKNTCCICRLMKCIEMIWNVINYGNNQMWFSTSLKCQG